MQPTILVTGALGNVGAEVIQALLARGMTLRAADLSGEKVLSRFGKQVEATSFNFSNPETYSTAFAGIEKVFLMRPPQITNVQKEMFPALEAARAAGVRHFVFLSLIGIEQNRVVPHFKIEQWLRASGLDYTFLRCSFFMQNLNTTHRAEIAERSEIFIPAGGAKTSFIDARDIGAVAAQALTTPGHEKKAYDLTGGAAFDYYQVAETFSEILGRKITYRNPSGMGFFARQLRQRANPMFALVTTWLYANTRRGMADTVTGEVERLLGRRPIPLRQYVEDYQDYWKLSA